MVISDNKKKMIIGMVHVGATPGTPFYEEGSLYSSTKKAVEDARAIYLGGAAGCLLQNNDRTYRIDNSDPIVVAHIARIATLIRQSVPEDFQVGVQLMINDARSSLAIAKVCGANFIRVVGLLGRTTTMHGVVYSNPNEILTYRYQIRAESIDIISQIDSVHFHWEGPKVMLGQLADAAAKLGVKAVEIADPDIDKAIEKINEIKQVRPQLPVMIGGYSSKKNIGKLMQSADGAFVGSAFEKGNWGGVVDVEAVKEFMAAVSGQQN